ncbi:hypothetical protein WME90_39635 [Sorangium sp. So ce375]|uniref:hypothetical protein n=1 Tax=Sorangium sp. So ce375 TaxID=3133306 RepID=UPI003F5C3D66
MSSHHARLFAGLAATWVLALSACSADDGAAGGIFDDGGATFGGGGGDYWSSGSGGTPPMASGGAGGAGGVPVTEDVNIPAAPEAQDPYTRFAHLCGDGCTPGGDPIECSSDGGDGAGAGLPGAQTLRCQLVLDDGDVIPSCRPVGRYEAGGPCHSSADCAAGLGCVAADGGGGVCRQYCCGNVEGCAAGTYCDERPMAESAVAGCAPVPIPVCVPAMNCELLNDSVCPEGLTCTIVREDGTTSCVVPGEGRADERCPCAPGFVCSMLTNQCKQLCRIDSRAQDCGAGAKCQGGSAIYPAGFGVCVSTS